MSARPATPPAELRLGQVVEALEYHGEYGQMVDLGEVGFVAYRDKRSVAPFDHFAMIEFQGGAFLGADEIAVARIDPKRLEEGAKRAIATARRFVTELEKGIEAAFEGADEHGEILSLGPQRQAALDAIAKASQAASLIARYRAVNRNGVRR